VKAALIEIQADEYGAGRADRMHSELFRATMRWLELDDSYGHYVPVMPAVTLAVSNLMSLFALHRRWTGALLGHLAALEMTSTGPNRLYAAGARRLGAGVAERRYFSEHVEADACCLALDDVLAGHLLSRWQAGQSSLRPLAEPVRECDPSQNGLIAERPHRHSATVRRPAGPLPRRCARSWRPRTRRLAAYPPLTGYRPAGAGSPGTATSGFPVTGQPSTQVSGRICSHASPES
jgi:Iron-containing redox enzyme